MKTFSIAANLKRRWVVCPMLLLALCASCSSSLDNRRGSAGRTKRGQSKPRFRSPVMDAMYKAAKASPRSFDPVYAYAKAVTDACLVSLADTSCPSCGEGAMRYKQKSDLEPQYWPIIEEALSMLEVLEKSPELAAPERMDLLIATKGRLLWLAGRSVEEQPLIDEYAKSHPDAVAVIRRRLELLHESGDIAASESQCTLSRAKTESSPDAARVDLLTACVALHPRNTNGRSDLLDYSKYLPNLTTAEETLYRKNLVERCEAKAGDEEASCAEGCACGDKDADKKCRRACSRCRGEMAQRLRLCKKITEAPSAVIRAPRPSPVSAPGAPGTDAPRPKVNSRGGLEHLEL